MKPTRPLIRSKMELIRLWKREMTDPRALRMVEKMPLMISKKEETRFWRPSMIPDMFAFAGVDGAFGEIVKFCVILGFEREIELNFCCSDCICTGWNVNVTCEINR